MYRHSLDFSSLRCVCLPHVYTVNRQLVPKKSFESYVPYLLRVHRSLQLRHVIGLANRAQEDGLELVHPSIREEEGWIIVGYHRGRGHCRRA